jgi:hypothetical protein
MTGDTRTTENIFYKENLRLQRLKNSIKPHFEACKVCGQEYCMEPMHNLEEEVLKEAQTDVNTSIQLNSHYLLKPQMWQEAICEDDKILVDYI